MFWNRVWIHLDVGESSRVSLKMHLEVTFRCESVTTYVALEGSLAGMGSDMDLEGRVTAKHFATVTTPVFVVRVFSITGFVVINESVGEESLRGVVEDIVGCPLQHLQCVGFIRGGRVRVLDD